MSDDDMMPFGKYGPTQGDHRKMSDVPASYLLWLLDNGCSNREVKSYIEENYVALCKEVPDRIANRFD